jgi:hypothetical protein
MAYEVLVCKGPSTTSHHVVIVEDDVGTGS